MRRLLRGLVPLLLLLPAAAVAQTVTAADLQRHIEVLASDAFEGRKPGTAGEARTLAYISAQFQAAGLRPAGADGGWLQPVPLVERRPSRETIRWIAGSRALPFDQSDFVAIGAEAEARIARAPVWFAGHGVRIPDKNIDQLEGTDLKGAVVLILYDGPELPGFPSFAERVRTVAEAGAAAVIGVMGEDVPWGAVTASFSAGQNRLGSDRVAPVQGAISQATAAKLIGAAGGDFEALLNSSSGPAFRPIRVGLTASLDVATEVRRYTSYNVVGRLPGSARAGENLLYLAHWDHLGRCRPAAADPICNGAVDNASGIAALIETARQLAAGPRPQRDILFLATTAEEIGLLGAAAFAASPPAPLESILAAVNIDTIAATVADAPVATIGRGHDRLDALISDTATELGRKVDTDREADALIDRQDGWALTRAGVPTVVIGGAISDMGRLGAYLAGDYHKPSDDLAHLPSLDGAAQDTTLLVALGRKLADPALYPAAER